MKSDNTADDSSFRDKISTVDTKGKRKWQYVLKPKGKFYTWRSILSLIYLVLFFAIPFIKINGNPFFLFNIPDARFVFFGKVFLPQDFILLGVGMLVSLLFIIVFTLIFGRVFCGWACPQTIFMEMVFRKIEYWLEGSATKQQKINNGKWTTEVYLRKTIKHIIFFIISFIIANTFLAYIIGVDQLFKIISEPVTQHFVGFVAIILFTIVFYLVFAFVRELVCTVVCPYGRLQSVLLDKNSIVVAYNYIRGEPREKPGRSRNTDSGDCVDCNLCVKVCPTGIDIRNGTQLECVNCTACIDACNTMMAKINKPLHLITYASENNIVNGEKPRFTYRIKAYSVMLILMIGLLVTLLVTRSMFDATILRVPGQTLQENADGTISNLYRIKVVNKNSYKKPYHLAIEGNKGTIAYIGKPLDSLESFELKEETFFIKLQPEAITQRKQKLTLNIMSNNKVVAQKKVSFIGEY